MLDIPIDEAPAPPPGAPDPAAPRPPPPAPQLPPPPAAGATPPAPALVPPPPVAAPVTALTLRGEMAAPPNAAGPVWLADLSVGGAALPDAVWNLVSDDDQHPALRGTVVDASLALPVGPARWLALRVGLVTPAIPNANWYGTKPSDAGRLPRWTEVNLQLLDIAADWMPRGSLRAGLDWHMRVGGGATIPIGSVTRVEALPTCAPTAKATCPHWHSVGRTPADLPMFVPSVRATAGVTWWFADRIGLEVGAGIRGAPWAGAGVVARL
ncbi:MAG: hypothetical protein EXR79_16215 [Myxococcales bacterium]|nr:hypothetical protein [Myxococcales bacterium]